MALHFETVGAGDRPVVLLHGFLGSGRNLFSLARGWSERDPQKRFFLVDLPGHGQSPPLPPRGGLRAVGEMILSWSRQVGLARPFEIAAHSLGGRVALAMVLVEDRAVGPVTLLDIAPGPTQHRSVDKVVAAMLAAPTDTASRAEMGEALIAAGASRPIADWLLMNVVKQGERYGWRIDREALAAGRSATDREDFWPAVERPDSPVKRCIRGGKSDFVSAEDAARLERAGCEVVTLDRAGHYLHVDDPDGLLRVLTQATGQSVTE